MKLTISTFLLLSVFVFSCTYTQKVRDGKFAYERKQYSVAVDLLQKEYKKAKSTIEKGQLAFLLAESYKNTNQIDKASEWYKTAYDFSYGVDALKEYAYSLKIMGDYKEAMQAFKDLGIEIGSPYEYRREIVACKIAIGWMEEKRKAYKAIIADFNTSQADYAPVLFEGNQLVFTSDRSTAEGEDTYNWTGADFSDLFVVDLKTNNLQPFDNQINTESNEGTAVFNKDYSEIYFTRCFGDKKQDNYCKIMTSRRLGDSWTIPVILNFIQEGVNYGDPAISEDGNTLYFSCNSTEGWGGFDIWQTQKTANGWDEPTLMGRSINSIGDERFPFLDNDTLYFSSDFHPGMGGLDIFKTYKMANGGWTSVQNLKPPINSGGDDFSYIIDYSVPKKGDLLQAGYFSSSRFGGEGNDDIYRFEKRQLPPLPPPSPDAAPVVYKMILKGYVLEKIYDEAGNPDSKYLGRKPLPGSAVDISYGKKKQTVTVDDAGSFTLELKEETDYGFIASKTEYLRNETAFSTKGIAKNPSNPIQEFEVEIVLDKIYREKEVLIPILYDFDKWDIRRDAQPILTDLARRLKLNPTIQIELSSHTDCQGSDRYNQELSQKRAQAAVNYLIEQGINGDRIIARGYGETSPIIDCVCTRCTEEEYQENRRTAFKILE
ncbi:MAG: peptidoglycan-associated lipoprotein [Saprospiraceae bacterium]|jgi:peptidoglycan-associated lipoprotein